MAYTRSTHQDRQKLSKGGFFLALLFLFTGSLLQRCGDKENGDNRVLPSNIGGNGEVIVVMPDALWQSALGDTVRHFLEKPQPVLPQPEPRFSVEHFPPGKLNDLMRKHRNIVFFYREKESEKSEEKEGPVKFLEDVWARDQLVIRVQGKEKSTMKRGFLENKDRLIDAIQLKERKRDLRSLTNKKVQKVQDSLKKLHDLSLHLPTDIRIMENHDSLIWLEKHEMRAKGNFEHDVIQGMIVYYHPYREEEDLEPKALLKAKDSIFREHIEGPSRGSYMTTERRYADVKPVSKKTNLNGEYALEIRGLWRVEGDQMGGPFVSLSTYDKKNERIVTAHGYVFAPKFNKRELLRPLEASAYSMEFH